MTESKCKLSESCGQTVIVPPMVERNVADGDRPGYNYVGANPRYQFTFACLLAAVFGMPTATLGSSAVALPSQSLR